MYHHYEKILWDRANATDARDLHSVRFIQKKIMRHETNVKGRDFIVGDLHGCVGYLDVLMNHVGFDTSTDRMFSVGDLTDRGPDSQSTLELLRESWFLSVMGNHDAMLMAVLMEYIGTASGNGCLSNVDRARAEIYGESFFGNGGNWLMPFLSESAQTDILTGWLNLLREIPLIRVVGSGATESFPTNHRSQDRFHVAHAELLGGDADWCDQLLNRPDAEDHPLWVAPHNIGGFGIIGDGVDHVLWGRELRAQVAKNDVPDRPDLSRTYVGHTITVMRDTSQLLAAGSHVFLDTGAYKSVPDSKGAYDRRHGLTIWCHQEARGWKWNGEKIEDVRLV